MIFRILKLVVLMLVAFLFAKETIAQEKTCRLYIKTFSYHAVESKKNRIENVSVTLTVKGKTTQPDSVSDTSANVFEGVENGLYLLDVTKKGYSEKKKQIEVDCKFADSDNILWHQVYIWKDKSKLANGSELIEDRKEVLKGDQKQPDKPKVFGSVSMRLWIDEDGNVVKATPVSGKKELFDTATLAAMKARFSPTLHSGVPVQVTGTVTYNFVP